MVTIEFNGPEGPIQRARRAPSGGGAKRAPLRATPLTDRGRSAVGQCRARVPAALRAFVRTARGSVAIESAVSIVVLVVAFGGLMAIAHTAYTDDRMGRAARAAARAVALAPDALSTEASVGALACKAIRQELGLDAEFDCAGAWTITIDTDLTPTALLGGAGADGVSGDVVLVRIAWQQAPWAQAVYQLEGADAGTAVGVARREPAS